MRCCRIPSSAAPTMRASRGKQPRQTPSCSRSLMRRRSPASRACSGFRRRSRRRWRNLPPDPPTGLRSPEIFHTANSDAVGGRLFIQAEIERTRDERTAQAAPSRVRRLRPLQAPRAAHPPPCDRRRTPAHRAAAAPARAPAAARRRARVRRHERALRPIRTATENKLEKCVACQHYDRDDAQASDKGTRWGKCRRNGPIIHPLSAKAYMVEGIWPHVRDDDWCGEWTTSKRASDPRAAEPRTSLLMAAPAAASAVRTSTLPGPSLMTPLTQTADSPAVPLAGRLGSD